LLSLLHIAMSLSMAAYIGCLYCDGFLLAIAITITR